MTIATNETPDIITILDAEQSTHPNPPSPQEIIWTHCPTCFYRTDHVKIEDKYLCMSCGCHH